MKNDYVEKQGKKIEDFLSHSFEFIDVTHVEPDEVEARAGIGFDAEDRKDKYQAYYRIKVPSETKQNILETREEVYKYLDNQLEEMEIQSSAPDTQILYSDHQVRHVEKPLVFYVISTL